MNPRRVWSFLSNKFGLFLIFLVVFFVGFGIYAHRRGGNQPKQKPGKHAGPVTKEVKLGQVKVPLEKGLENGLPQQAATPQVTSNETRSDGVLVPFRPASGTAAADMAVQGNAPTKKDAKDKPSSEPPKRIRYASLLASYTPVKDEPASKPAAPDRFLPFGTLLKCKLVNTVDSANIETPVIAVLLEDVWQNGRLVIPANTLLHGIARAGRIRDRINASGTWRFVWQDGRELPFSGVALDREYEHDIDGYGITDGSAGMKGRLMATDDYQELKMLASAALSGFARGTQDRSQTALGSTITGSVSNGVREGAGAVFELFAERTLKDIEQNGYYVRVSAGKEFYVYVVQSVLPEKAKVAGTQVEPDWTPQPITTTSARPITSDPAMSLRPKG